MSSGGGTKEAEVVMAGMILLSCIILAIELNNGLSYIGSGLKEIANAIERASRR